MGRSHTRLREYLKVRPKRHTALPKNSILGWECPQVAERVALSWSCACLCLASKDTKDGGGEGSKSVNQGKKGRALQTSGTSTF